MIGIAGFLWSPALFVVVVALICVWARRDAPDRGAPDRGASDAGDDPWRSRVDMPLAIGSGLLFGATAAFVLAPRYILGGDYIDVDLAIYCRGLGDARDLEMHNWQGKLSLWAGYLLAPLARSVGVLGALTGGAVLAGVVFGAGVYVWARSAAGRVAGVSAVILAGANHHLVLLTRNPSFYAETTAAAVISMASVAAALRWRSPVALFLGGCGVGLVLLADNRFLTMGCWSALLLLLAALPGPPARASVIVSATGLNDDRCFFSVGEADPSPHRPRHASSPSSPPRGAVPIQRRVAETMTMAPARLALRLGLAAAPVLASWLLASAAYSASGASEGYTTGAVAQAAAFLRDVPGYPPPSGSFEEIMKVDHAWGHDSITRIPGALSAIVELAGRVPPERARSPDVLTQRAAFVDLWFLPLGVAALAALVGQRRRPWELLAGLGLATPFFANLAFVSGTLPQSRVFALGMIAVPILLGIGIGAGGGRRWRPAPAAALLGFLAASTLGVLPGFLSPWAAWRTPECSVPRVTAILSAARHPDRADELLRDLRGDPMIAGCLAAVSADLAAERTALAFSDERSDACDDHAPRAWWALMQQTER